MNIIYWLLIISSFNNNTFKTNSQPQMEAAICGNSICESSLGENCETCPGDCPCDIGSECVTGVCTPIVGCGNLYCESFLGESCGSCPGDCPCPPDQICLNGICTYDTTGFVGVNNTNPKTALDVSGALSHRSLTIQANNDTISIPENVSLAVIVGYNPMFDSITILLPTNNADGQRLIIKNTTTVPLYVNTFFNISKISQTHNSEFIYTSNNGWSLLGKSEDVNTDLFWKISGNNFTSPFYDFLGTIDSTDLILKTNSNERIIITNDGNVGIGTIGFSSYVSGSENKLRVISKDIRHTGLFANSPGNFVNYSGNSSAVYGVNENYRNGSNYGGYFTSIGSCPTCIGNNVGIYTSALAGNGNIGLIAKASDTDYNLAAHFQDGRVRFDNNIGIRLAPVSNTVLRLDKPQFKTFGATFLFENGNRGNVTIGNGDILGGGFAGLTIAAGQGQQNENDLAIVAFGRSLFLDELAIGLQGFTPGYKLSVDGKIIAEELRIQNSIDWIPWPDYVFAKDYNLRNLKQLEEFINKNSHLPEVPSASEVKENGIEVGDMQKTLLKKIEELTLYIIDQQKQIDELKLAIQKNELKK